MRRYIAALVFAFFSFCQFETWWEAAPAKIKRAISESAGISKRKKKKQERRYGAALHIDLDFRIWSQLLARKNLFADGRIDFQVAEIILRDDLPLGVAQDRSDL